MSKVTLYCAETPGLKLGPGVAVDSNHVPGELIVFHNGFATIDEADFPGLRRWLEAPGTPTIRVLEDGESTSATDGAACPECGRLFKTDFALNGHLRSHAPKS